MFLFILQIYINFEILRNRRKGERRDRERVFPRSGHPVKKQNETKVVHTNIDSRRNS